MQNVTSYERTIRDLLAREYELPATFSLRHCHTGVSSLIWELACGEDESRWYVKLVFDHLRAQRIEHELQWMERLAATKPSKSTITIPDTLKTKNAKLLVENTALQKGILFVQAGIPSRPRYNFLGDPPSDVEISSAAASLRELHERANRICAQGIDAPHAPCFVMPAPMLQESLPRTVLHGDFHPGNVSFSGGICVGVFDFEYARSDFRFWDLAYASLFFCADWREAKPNIDNARMKLFIRAYQEVEDSSFGMVRDAELGLLPYAQRVICEANLSWADVVTTYETEKPEYLNSLRNGSAWFLNNA